MEFSRRRRTYIRVPKTDLWYLGFQVSAIPTDQHGLQSDTELRGPPLRPPPPLPSLAPHPQQAARPWTLVGGHTPLTWHSLFGATNTGSGTHKSAPRAHFSLMEKTKLNSKNNFRAEGALTFECDRRTSGTLVFRCPRSRQIVTDLRAPEVVRGTLLRPPPSTPGLARHPHEAARPSECAAHDIPLS